MPTTSFLKSIAPARPRERIVDWPIEHASAEPVQVRVQVLGSQEIEEAYFATLDHFKDRKPKVAHTDPAFIYRERAELVFRAFSTPGKARKPIAENVDEIMSEPAAVRDALYWEFASLQADVAPPSYTAAQIDSLIEELKKKPPSDLLTGSASSTLIGLITTLVGRLPVSTTESGSGSQP